jgi:hypothetical protein
LEILPDDGPSLTLSEFMEVRHKNIVPEEWAGFRNIDEKEEAPIFDFKPAFDDEINDEDNEDIDDNDSLS